MKPKIKSNLTWCSSFLALTVVCISTTAQAFTFQTNWPNSPMDTDIMAHPTLDYGVKYLYEWGIGLGGIAVFIVLVMAGFQYITSVGDPTKMKEAFKRIEDAVVGLLVLLSSWAILNLVGLNLNSINISIFTPKPVDPIKKCSGVEGDPAPQCCETIDSEGRTVKINNCREDLWTCYGSSASDTEDKGICQPNTKTEKCSKVVIYYDNKDTDKLELGSGLFNIKQRLSTTKNATKMERWFDDGGMLGMGSTPTLCYDPTNPKANDANINKACNCSVQILTKISGAGDSTDPCLNTAGNVFVATNDEFVSNNNSIKVLCVLINSPE